VRDRARAFSLIELLVVVAIIGVLLAILVPGLGAARSQGRLTVCVSNVRQQGTVLSMYALDNGDALPPRLTWWTTKNDEGEWESGPWLINRILADYHGERFIEKADGGFETPHTMWRCPEVGLEEDDVRTSHSGIIHHVPNQWLFSNAIVNEQTASAVYQSDAPGPYWEKWGGEQWRTTYHVDRHDATVTLMGNVYYFNEGHGHFEAREFYSHSCEVPSEPEPCQLQTSGSHDELRVRPAAFLDGHAEALDSRNAYWLGEQQVYQPPYDSGTVLLYDRAVEHLLWFVSPADAVGGGD